MTLARALCDELGITRQSLCRRVPPTVIWVRTGRSCSPDDAGTGWGLTRDRFATATGGPLFTSRAVPSPWSVPTRRPVPRSSAGQAGSLPEDEGAFAVLGVRPGRSAHGQELLVVQGALESRVRLGGDCSVALWNCLQVAGPLTRQKGGCLACR